jgi:hypothetical protein
MSALESGQDIKRVDTSAAGINRRLRQLFYHDPWIAVGEMMARFILRSRIGLFGIVLLGLTG